MAAHLHVRPLFHSPLLGVEDVRCRPLSGACGEEEFVRAPALALVRRGIFRKHVGAEEVLADVNQVIFFNPGESYRVSHPAAGGDDCTALTFAPDVVREAVAVYRPRTAERESVSFSAPAALVPAQVALAVQTLRHRSGPRAGDAVEFEGLGLAILAVALRSSSVARGDKPARLRSGTRRAHGRIVEETRLFLAERSGERLALSTIAKAVRSSPFHLVRIFRRETGIPVHRYLTRLRLRGALQRLAEGCEDLTSLALAAGFSSHSHFTDAFRREFGVAPGQFRAGLSKEWLREISKILEVRVCGRG